MRDFDDRLKHVARELRKLQGTETPIARRNARKRVLTAMRGLRGALDKAYPPIVDRTGVTRLKTFEGRLARLERAGYVLIDSSYVRNYVSAGVKPRYLEHRTPGEGSKQAWLVPRWARAIGWENPAQIRVAKKSRKVRAAVIVAEAL